MSMLQVRPASSNLDRHPSTPRPSPRPRPTRPFGEGLVEPAEVNIPVEVVKGNLEQPTPSLPDRFRVTRGLDAGDWSELPRYTNPALADRRRWARQSDGRTIGQHWAAFLRSEGELVPLPIAAKGPTAEDFAYEHGRSLGLELEGPSETPSHYSAAEASAFEQGQASASRELDERAAYMADKAGVDWDRIEDAELAEARLTRPPY